MTALPLVTLSHGTQSSRNVTLTEGRQVTLTVTLDNVLGEYNHVVKLEGLDDSRITAEDVFFAPGEYEKEVIIQAPANDVYQPDPETFTLTTALYFDLDDGQGLQRSDFGGNETFDLTVEEAPTGFSIETLDSTEGTWNSILGGYEVTEGNTIDYNVTLTGGVDPNESHTVTIQHDYYTDQTMSDPWWDFDEQREPEYTVTFNPGETEKVVSVTIPETDYQLSEGTFGGMVPVDNGELFLIKFELTDSEGNLLTEHGDGAWAIDSDWVDPNAPVVEPTPDPVPAPVPAPSPEPVVEPTPEPVVEPTPEPVVEPTPEPVVEPTPDPVVVPEPVVEDVVFTPNWNLPSKQNLKGGDVEDFDLVGEKDLITGTGKVKGSSEDDLFRTFNEDDKLIGRGGDDYLRAGAGDDLLRGGKGDDVLFGNGGDDIFRDGRGDDFMILGGGDDTVYLGSGDNFVADFNENRDTLIGKGGIEWNGNLGVYDNGTVTLV